MGKLFSYRRALLAVVATFGGFGLMLLLGDRPDSASDGAKKWAVQLSTSERQKLTRAPELVPAEYRRALYTMIDTDDARGRVEFWRTVLATYAEAHPAKDADTSALYVSIANFLQPARFERVFSPEDQATARDLYSRAQKLLGDEGARYLFAAGGEADRASTAGLSYGEQAKRWLRMHQTNTAVAWVFKLDPVVPACAEGPEGCHCSLNAYNPNQDPDCGTPAFSSCNHKWNDGSCRNAYNQCSTFGGSPDGSWSWSAYLSGNGCGPYWQNSCNRNCDYNTGCDEWYPPEYAPAPAPPVDPRFTTNLGIGR